jgi:hypothetical protein
MKTGFIGRYLFVLLTPEILSFYGKFMLSFRWLYLLAEFILNFTACGCFIPGTADINSPIS